MKELDFLPESYRQAAERRRQNRRNLMLTGVMVGAMTLLLATNEQRLNTARASLATLRSANGAFQNARELANSYRQRRDQLVARDELLDRLEDNAPLDAILGEITRLLSPDMTLREVEIVADDAGTAGTESPNPQAGPAGEPPVKSPPPAPGRGLTRVQLSGTARTDMEVGVFFGRLSSCPLFDNARMVFSQESRVNDRPMRAFQITLEVRRIEIKP